MRKSRFCIFYLFLALLSIGCAKKGETNDKAILVVSIEPLRNITEQLAGDEYRVETILDKGANPETYDPSMSRMAAVDKSKAFFSTGAFPFEEKLAEVANKNVQIKDVTEGIKRVYGTHTHNNGEECHHEADPHTWTSAKNAKIIGNNIAKVLADINPERAMVYRNRLDSLALVIDKLDGRIAEQLDSVSTRSFAIWHPSLSYMARDYNLKQVAVGQENKEISPRRMKEIIEEATNESIKVFFFQKEFDSNQAITINESLGAKMVTIDPLAYDWMKQLEIISDALSE